MSAWRGKSQKTRGQGEKPAKGEPPPHQPLKKPPRILFLSVGKGDYLYPQENKAAAVWKIKVGKNMLLEKAGVQQKGGKDGAKSIGGTARV